MPAALGLPFPVGETGSHRGAGYKTQTWHRRRGEETRWANHTGREPGLPIKTARAT